MMGLFDAILPRCQMGFEVYQWSFDHGFTVDILAVVLAIASAL
jgi:hypothetical protein